MTEREHDPDYLVLWPVFARKGPQNGSHGRAWHCITKPITERQIMTLEIGDSNRNDTVRITDTRWDSNGTMFVTVREMIGGYESWAGGRRAAVRAMRATARRAIHHQDKTRKSPLVREWYANGQHHATFAVSRLS